MGLLRRKTASLWWNTGKMATISIDILRRLFKIFPQGLAVPSEDSHLAHLIRKLRHRVNIDRGGPPFLLLWLR